MVTDALEEMALSFHRNTEEQDEICDKHKIPLIKILRTNDILCRLCERNGSMPKIRLKSTSLLMQNMRESESFILKSSRYMMMC